MSNPNLIQRFLGKIYDGWIMLVKSFGGVPIATLRVAVPLRYNHLVVNEYTLNDRNTLKMETAEHTLVQKMRDGNTVVDTYRIDDHSLKVNQSEDELGRSAYDLLMA